MKPTPTLDAIEAEALTRDALESTCELEADAFWRLAKELDAPHWKTALQLQFDTSPPRRVLVTRSGAHRPKPAAQCVVEGKVIH